MFWIISVICISVFGTIAFSEFNTKQTEVEMARAGLQQCFESGPFGSKMVLWKKECK